MKTTAFLSRVIGDDGHYCLFAARRSDDRKLQRFYTDITTLIQDARTYDAHGYDTYFALSTFKTDGGRSASNSKQLKSFFLDLDCGPKKEFVDQSAALSALQSFCKAVSLPKPMLVSSGNGIHVYWTLSDPVGPDMWTPVAKRLKALCVEHNFAADPVVTANAAQILRLPHTHNHKSADPLKVAVLAQASSNTMSFDDFAEIVGVAPVHKPSTHVPAKFNAMSQLLMSNKKSSFRKILTRSDTCAQIMRAVTEQSTVDEPLWRATLSVAAFCEDSEKAIHAVSREHPEYDPDVTEEKASRIKGPYHCTRFNEYNPGGCEGCPHLGNITSPITLGNELRRAETEEDRTVEIETNESDGDGWVETEKVVVPEPPYPYVRGTSGGVYRTMTNDDGDVEDVLVYHHDIYVTRRVWDVELGYMVVTKLHLPRDGIREFTISQQVVSSADELRKALSKEGVTCKTKKQWESLGMYITDYIEELQNRAEADQAHRQFGWTDDFKSFVIGDREYFADRVGYSPATPTTAALIPEFEPKGTLEEWKDLISFYNVEGTELHQMLICAGFGSPLMAFSAVNSLLTHLDGPTGFGKTTTQMAMLGIYGNPHALMLDEQDTLNSKLLRMEVLKNLPMAIDELTNHTASEASVLIYSLSGGRQKNRMASGSNTERVRGKPWAMRAISSGNTSIIGKIETIKADPEAERERAFEINISGYIYPHEKGVADEFQNRVKNQVYGVAAEPYIKWLVANVEEARKAFLDMQARLDHEAGLSSKNRFVSAGYAADLVGGRIAQMLGLIDFDMKKLFKFTVNLIRQRAAEIEESQKTNTDYLVDYLTEHYNDILRIKSTQDLRNREGSAGEEFVVPDASPRGQYVARYETDLKRLYLLPKPFKLWCSKLQLNPLAMIKGLAEEYKVERIKIRLGRGTKLDIPPADVYAINFAIEDHVNEHVEDSDKAD